MPKKRKTGRKRKTKRSKNKYIRLFRKLKQINKFARKHKIISKSLKYGNLAGNLMGFPTTLGYEASARVRKLGYGLYRK